MPRLVLKVGGSPRWSGTENRWQQPGEQIVLDIDDAEEFKRQCYLHSAHCSIVEGELPDFNPKPSFLSRVVAKVGEVVSGVLSPDFATLAEMKAADKADHKSKADARAQAEHQLADGELKCADCGAEFKSSKGLIRHFERSGHGKMAKEADGE